MERNWSWRPTNNERWQPKKTMTQKIHRHTDNNRLATNSINLNMNKRNAKKRQKNEPNQKKSKRNKQIKFQRKHNGQQRLVSALMNEPNASKIKTKLTVRQRLEKLSLRSTNKNRNRTQKWLCDSEHVRRLWKLRNFNGSRLYALTVERPRSLATLYFGAQYLRCVRFEHKLLSAARSVHDQMLMVAIRCDWSNKPGDVIVLLRAIIFGCGSFGVVNFRELNWIAQMAASRACVGIEILITSHFNDLADLQTNTLSLGHCAVQHRVQMARNTQPSMLAIWIVSSRLRPLYVHIFITYLRVAHWFGHCSSPLNYCVSR